MTQPKSERSDLAVVCPPRELTSLASNHADPVNAGAYDGEFSISPEISPPKSKSPEAHPPETHAPETETHAPETESETESAETPSAQLRPSAPHTESAPHIEHTPRKGALHASLSWIKRTWMAEQTWGAHLSASLIAIAAHPALWLDPRVYLELRGLGGLWSIVIIACLISPRVFISALGVSFSVSLLARSEAVSAWVIGQRDLLPSFIVDGLGRDPHLGALALGICIALIDLVGARLTRRDPLESLCHASVIGVGVGIWMSWLWASWSTWSLDGGWSYALLLAYLMALTYVPRLRWTCLALGGGALYVLSASVELGQVSVETPLQYLDLTLLRALAWVLSF